jgi:dTDP-glucose 4,6-dehydratase
VYQCRQLRESLASVYNTAHNILGVFINLLVVGGAGFIGINYINFLLEGKLKGISGLTILDTFTYAANKSALIAMAESYKIEIMQIDICDREKLLSIQKKFNVILNFAAETHVDRSIESPTIFMATNILGLQNLLDLAHKLDSKFIQVSTDEVYGSIESGSWDESCPLLPNSPYAASKAAGDLLLRSYIKTYKLEGVLTRSCNNYGPYQHLEKFIPKAITNLQKGLAVPVYGSGLNSREWIHVHDNVKGIHLGLLNGKSGSIFNLGSGQEHTNLEIFSMICDIGGFDPSLILYVPDRLGHDQRYSLNFSKAKAELGFSPSMRISDGLKATIEWYEKQTL